MGKYVPPHLRKKEGEEGADSGALKARSSSLQAATKESTEPSSVRSASSSLGRATSLGQAANNSRTTHDRKQSKSPGWGGSDTKTASRWKNVNREEIGRGHRNNHRHRNNPRILFFGDSFVRLFGLLKHSDLRVEGFKGASAKGLGRAGNENRATIVQQIQQFRPDRVVLCFGNVDVHLSYYFTKYVKEGPTIDLEAVAEAYLDFVGTLKELVDPQKIHVVGMYPSPLRPEHLEESLVAYGVLPEGSTLPDEDKTIEGRQARVCSFNKALERCCAKHGVSFECAYEDVLDPTTNLLKPSFQDVSSHNIHIVWETTVLLWMDRWSWFRELAEPGFKASLQETLDEYLKTKPWAETQHVAASVGVEGAFNMDKTET